MLLQAFYQIVFFFFSIWEQKIVIKSFMNNQSINSKIKKMIYFKFVSGEWKRHREK